MAKVEARRPMRGGAIHEGIFLECQHNIFRNVRFRDTLEMDVSRVFNELPKVCRDSGTYKSFYRLTEKPFMD